MTIRQKVSDILGISIQEGRWVSYTATLDREGSFTRKTMLDILMALCEAVEDLENQVESLKFKEDQPKNVKNPK